MLKAILLCSYTGLASHNQILEQPMKFGNSDGIHNAVSLILLYQLTDIRSTQETN